MHTYNCTDKICQTKYTGYSTTALLFSFKNRTILIINDHKLFELRTNAFL